MICGSGGVIPALSQIGLTLGPIHRENHPRDRSVLRPGSAARVPPKTVPPGTVSAKALFMTVWPPSTRSAENSCGICTAPGFLDSGLTVFASTPPRPARGGRVAPGPGFGSRTSPASTARCTSA